MQFKDIIGQDKIQDQLKDLVKESRVAHAILFNEIEGSGALALAIAFAQYLCCPNRDHNDSCGVCPVCVKFSKLAHPDLHFVFPVNSSKSIQGADKKPISDTFISKWREFLLNDLYFSEKEWSDYIGIDNKVGFIGVNEAVSIMKKLSLRSFESGSKFLIIWLPERMNIEAANKLLKLIEEPPLDTYIIMVSSASEKILTTILSRCQFFNLPPIEEQKLSSQLGEEFDLDPDMAAKISRLSRGSLSKAREIVIQAIDNKEFDGYIQTLFEACIYKDYIKLISFYQDAGQLNRDSQKRLCINMADFLRKILITKAELPELSILNSQESAFINLCCKKINSAFIYKSSKLIDKAIMDIDANVNGKYIFCDLANTFFVSL
jgi:DNA polymerase-3 subunit delta'